MRLYERGPRVFSLAIIVGLAGMAQAQTRVTLTDLDQRLSVVERRPDSPQLAMKRWYSQNARIDIDAKAGPGTRTLEFDGKHIWVATCGAFSEIDATSNEVIGSNIAFPSGPTCAVGLAFDGVNLWMAAQNGKVVKLRVSDRTIQGTFSAGSAAGAILYDGANLWVTNSATVTRLDLNGTVTGTFSVGSNPASLVFDGSSLWVSNSGSNNVMKIRPSDGAILGTFAVNQPGALLYDGSSIWIANSSAGFTKLRASDGAALGTVSTPAQVLAMAFDGQNVFGSGASQMFKIRVSDGSLVGTFPLLSSAFSNAVLYDGGNVWVGYAIATTFASKF